MSYSSVLIHVGLDKAIDARLRFAVALANRFGATLIGLGAEVLLPRAGDQPVSLVDNRLALEMADVDQARVAQLTAKARFEDLAKPAAGGFDWRAEIDFPADAVARNARAADIIVAAQRHVGNDLVCSTPDAADLLVECGRPVLIAPDGVDHLDLDGAVVAWKDTREARRAVMDAVPLLRQARKVIVAGISEGDEDAWPAVEDVAAYLRRCGVAAEAEVRARGEGVSVTDELIRLIVAEKADLLVAGGYGHARMREWVFGGVTKDLLKRAPVSVLFSH